MIPFSDMLRDGVWITATVGFFLACRVIYRRLGHSLLHPVLWSTLLLVGLVAITHPPISAYQTETAPLVWLLGPAVVAMSVPIWERRSLILANWRVLAALVCLSLICAIGSLVLLRGLLGDEVARALTLKSVVALDNFGNGRGTLSQRVKQIDSSH